MSKTTFPEPPFVSIYGVGVDPTCVYAAFPPRDSSPTLITTPVTYESSSTVYVYETPKEVLEAMVELQQENKKLKKEVEKYKKIIAKAKKLQCFLRTCLSKAE